MALSAAREPVNTPYRRILDSRAGKAVREHKILTGVGVIGGSIVVAGAAAQSPVAEAVTRYGLVPAVGAGLATLGATAVHDAFVNDMAEHKGRAALKIGAGTGATLGGVQMIGLAYDIPVLDQALSGTVEKVFEHGEALLGAGVAGGGVMAGRFALQRARQAVESAEGRAVNVALAATGGTASVAGVLGGAELIGRQYGIAGLDRAFTATVQTLAETPAASVVGGAALIGGAGVLVSEGLANVRRGGNDFVTLAQGMGAVTAGLGGAELTGHGLGVEALRGALTHHADSVGSVAVAGLGAALAHTSGRSVAQSGLRPLNSLGLAVGSAIVPLGLGLGAATFGLHQAAEIGARGAGLVAGLGLGATTFALGRKAAESARSGNFGGAALSGAGAAGTASLSLFAVGESLGIEAVSRLGREVADATVVPLWDKVLAPSMEFLFEHPIAGAVILAAGIGAVAWYNATRD